MNIFLLIAGIIILIAGIIYLKVSKGIKKVVDPRDKQSKEVKQKLNEYEERSKAIGLLMLLAGIMAVIGFIKSIINF